MAKKQTYIAIGLEDLTQRPLKKIFGNLFKIEDTVKDVTDKFSIFGNSGKKDSKKLEKSIADLQFTLEQELQDLKSKRYFTKNIDDVKNLNLEIQDLENEIKDLQGISDNKGSLIFCHEPSLRANVVMHECLDFQSFIKPINIYFICLIIKEMHEYLTNYCE